MPHQRRAVDSGAEWEHRYGYRRAIAVGDHAWVAGTTAASDGSQVSADAESQAKAAFAIAVRALGELDFDATDVVRTRMYIVDPADADAVGRVHGEVFAASRPVATMVVVRGLVDPALVVEIELDAQRAPSGAA